jgi:hypothetical protein
MFALVQTLVNASLIFPEKRNDKSVASTLPLHFEITGKTRDAVLQNASGKTPSLLHFAAER